MVSAIAEVVHAAEIAARIAHDEGRCGESEWSCSYCEQDAARPTP